MEATRWERLKDLVARALDMEPSARTAFLADSCGGDGALHAEAVSLLAAETGRAAFLERGVTLDGPPDAGMIGTRLGPYRVERVLGKGGMGTVYLAARDDDTFEKRAAIKVLKAGMDGRGFVTRFQRERQILAALEHANIARLLDGGQTGDGRPYLVMEYIEGEPIDAYCDRLKLGTEARLRLFQQVCAAIHFAHQNLVVHRDIKPSNILVTTDGTVKLLDFGIAKMLLDQEAGDQTRTLDMASMMTPEYASPEQIRGEAITTVSDVYALGVLLFELLAGQRPYELPRWTPEAVRAVICNQVPPRVSAIRPAGEGGWPRGDVGGDLDAIVAKALRKEPAARYASVQQFSDDIERYFKRLPVLARKNTLGYLAGRFARRHRLALATAALLAAVLSVTLWMTIASHQRVLIQRARAQQLGEFVIGVFELNDPYRQADEPISPRDMLDQAVGRLEENLAGQPVTRAAMQHTMGTIYVKVGEYETGGRLLNEALSLRTRHLGDRHPEVGETLTELGALRFAEGRYEEGVSFGRRAVTILEAEKDPHPTWLARTLQGLGNNLQGQMNLAEAEPLYQRAIAILEAGGGDPETVHLQASCLNDLGTVMSARGNVAEAAESFRKALNHAESVYGPDHFAVGEYVHNLGIQLGKQKDYEGAEALLSRVLDLTTATVGRDHQFHGKALNSLGMLMMQQDDLSRAAGYFQRALAVNENHLGTDHPQLAFPLNNLAEVLRMQGRPQLAEPLMQRALAITENALGREHRSVSMCLITLARIHRDLERWQDAERHARRALTIRERALGESHPRTKEARELLAALHRQCAELGIAVSQNP